MSSQIQVIDEFKRKPSDKRPDLDLSKAMNESYEDEMRELLGFARILNKDNVPVTITFTGNTTDGLESIVRCEDKELERKMRLVFIHYIASRDEL